MLTERQRLALMWLVAAAVFFAAIWVCLGSPRKNRFPTQGAGAADLLDLDNGKGRQLAFLPAATKGLPPRRYYFAATATADNSLTSDYSNEVSYLRTNSVRFVKLAWDRSPGTNFITNYMVWRGLASRTYTANFNAGTNLQLVVPLFDPPLSNLVITITSENATNLAWAADLKGPWTNLNATNWLATNPPSPRFFRALGKSKVVPGKVSIKGVRQ